jgi:hypothetical protein
MSAQDIPGFFAQTIPAAWFHSRPNIEFDDEEILCVGELRAGTTVEEFREASRGGRMSIAADAEARFHRKVSWGVVFDGRTTLFTTQSTPVMTRLRLSERAVLDTLITSGVARSRSEALAWCVKLVGRHQAEWLEDLRGALIDVERVRAEGPTLI